MFRYQMTLPDILTHYDTVHMMYILLVVFVTLTGNILIDLCLICPPHSTFFFLEYFLVSTFIYLWLAININKKTHQLCTWAVVFKLSGISFEYNFVVQLYGSWVHTWRTCLFACVEIYLTINIRRRKKRGGGGNYFRFILKIKSLKPKTNQAFFKHGTF